MDLTVFQSNKGDCLLLTSNDGKSILIDGGMPNSYEEHVGPALNKMHTQGKKLDVVYVSHIDSDHIAGILRMINDLADWRAFEFQTAHGNPSFPSPKSLRPPEVEEIWHNAFFEQMGRNAGPIESMLAAVSSVLSRGTDGQIRDVAERVGNLTTGVSEAIRLSRRVGAAQLGIALNRPAQGKLMLAREGRHAFRRGTLSLSIIGPFEPDVRKLRTEWNKWLGDNKKRLRDIRAEARKDEDRLHTDVDRLRSALTTQAELLGRRGKVTTPNLASLMFFVQEGSRTVILTGDGHHEDILKGLRKIGKLGASGGIHVDILKVQHHGSENNMDPAFSTTVTADNYVFCANGAHKNPDPRIVELVIDSRLGPANKKSPNAKVDDPFTLWFNSSADAVKDSPDRKKHMQGIEQLVRQRAGQSNGKLRFNFLRDHQFTIPL